MATERTLSDQEREALRGRLALHPVQYAVVTGPGMGVFGTTRWHTEHLTDEMLGRERWPQAPGLAAAVRTERYNRCPTCEEWSPCTKRQEILAAHPRVAAMASAPSMDDLELHVRISQERTAAGEHDG